MDRTALLEVGMATRDDRETPARRPGSSASGWSARASSWPTMLGVVLVGVLITGVVWHTAPSGSPTGLVHLYYLPVIYVAAFVGPAAAAFVAILAGLAAGPLVPVAGHVSVTSSEQPVSEWLVRLSLMVVVAVVVAWLARRQARPVDLLVRDAVSARTLRGALASGEIALHFQPVIALEDGRVAGVEALCRWTDRSGRSVPPAEFIPLAERTGVIHELGAWVLRTAVRQAEEWSAAMSETPTMAVNVSADQLGHEKFRALVAEVLAHSPIEPRQLVLEITETAIIADREAALATVRAARELGARVALDDFGTGTSSLAQLAGFPIDIVKIDKGFVDGVDHDPTMRALVRAIVSMAEALGALAVAEGIERPSQLAVLRELGCPFGQGFDLGRPAPAGAVDLTPRTVP
ncbi:EAL domain-containing protein [Actinotalea sp. M2MS4P-6]|uniref:EAL domain-containing protein n=1 Tax=Actinotalea sp. M2MS4P-6 TaxID=2983762 RepID=UPI0021E3BCC3|nr:EAL domain-containing protein [Actinotalea sp. M2MS4P-6]MCV2393287.1 EAL domain-containing protein [Actinotalea sp. M2MS4P-6]